MTASRLIDCALLFWLKHALSSNAHLGHCSRADTISSAVSCGLCSGFGLADLYLGLYCAEVVGDCAPRSGGKGVVGDLRLTLRQHDVLHVVCIAVLVGCGVGL